MNEMDVQIEVMRAAGLKDSDILRLAEVKRKIKSRELDELTIEFKRAMFLKHLHTSGRIREWAVSSIQEQNQY